MSETDRLLLAQLCSQPLRPVVVRTRLERQGVYVPDAAERLHHLACRGLAVRVPRYGYTLARAGEAALEAL